jgi:hypothetical protein
MLNSRSSFGSWQRIFGTNDRFAVESFCRARDISFEWRRGDTLHTREVRPAVRTHPVTGERVWFNQAHMWHITNSPIPLDEQLLSEDDFPMNASFGDGSRFDIAMLDDIRSAYRSATRMFEWQAGDLLLLDNMLVAHGRMPFRGPRQVMVAMGNR